MHEAAGSHLLSHCHQRRCWGAACLPLTCRPCWVPSASCRLLSCLFENSQQKEPWSLLSVRGLLVTSKRDLSELSHTWKVIGRISGYLQGYSWATDQDPETGTRCSSGWAWEALCFFLSPSLASLSASEFSVTDQCPLLPGPRGRAWLSTPLFFMSWLESVSLFSIFWEELMRGHGKWNQAVNVPRQLCIQI